MGYILDDIDIITKNKYFEQNCNIFSNDNIVFLNKYIFVFSKEKRSRIYKKRQN